MYNDLGKQHIKNWAILIANKKYNHIATITKFGKNESFENLDLLFNDLLTR